MRNEMMIPQLQGSPEWVAFRSTRVGASDSPVLMGCGYITPLDLYNQKKGITEPYVTEAMKRGSEMETIARAWYQKFTGHYVTPCVKVHPVYENIHASFDGMSFEGDHVAEFKCPGTNTLKDIGRYGIPDSYRCQCQHLMFVGGLESIDLVVFDGIRGKIYLIERDEEYILKMLDKILAFLECLRTNTPPEPSGISYIERDDDEWNNAAQKHIELLAKQKQLEIEVEESRKKLIALANDQNCTGFGLSICQITKKGNVDYGKIEALKGIDLEQYRKPPTTSWRISTK